MFQNCEQIDKKTFTLFNSYVSYHECETLDEPAYCDHLKSQFTSSGKFSGVWFNVPCYPSSSLHICTCII